MHLRRRIKAFATEEVLPKVKLWLLRALVMLDGHREFIKGDGIQGGEYIHSSEVSSHEIRPSFFCKRIFPITGQQQPCLLARRAGGLVKDGTSSVKFVGRRHKVTVKPACATYATAPNWQRLRRVIWVISAFLLSRAIRGRFATLLQKLSRSANAYFGIWQNP
jgi:hypothetical protein